MAIKQITSFFQKKRFYDRLLQSIESENIEGITIEQVTYESDSKTIHYKEVVVKRKRTHIEMTLERDEYRCVICDSGKDDLDIHHVDKDSSNNSIYNLLTLCHKCHMKLHNVKHKLKKWV